MVIAAIVAALIRGGFVSGGLMSIGGPIFMIIVVVGSVIRWIKSGG